MRTSTIGLLSIVMAGYLAHSQTVETTYEGPEGFASFGFGSSIEYVKTEMGKEGYEVTETSPGAVWYLGEFEGYITDFVYIFDDDDHLTGGMFLMRDQSQEAYDIIQEALTKIYPNEITMTITSFSTSTKLFGPGLKIIHVRDDESHRVQYYETDHGN